MKEAILRWFRRKPPTPSMQVLALSPACSVCGAPAAKVQLSEYAEGWRLVFEGVAGSGNGVGDSISNERAQSIRQALTPPFESATIEAVGFYDDFGFCRECKAFYCSTHWQVSTTGGGTCPAGIIDEGIANVRAASVETGGAAEQVVRSAGDLGRQAAKLQTAVEKFLSTVRAA